MGRTWCDCDRPHEDESAVDVFSVTKQKAWTPRVLAEQSPRASLSVTLDVERSAYPDLPMALVRETEHPGVLT